MMDQAAGAARDSQVGGTSEARVGMSPPGYRLPASVRLGPVRLQVADLGRSEEFYRQVLGLVRSGRDPEGGSERESDDGPRSGSGTSSRGPRRALLGVEGEDGERRTLVELFEKPGVSPVPPRGRLGLYHFALRVPDREALARTARRFRELGVRMGAADHLVSEALYLTDPDGLGIEVYRDRPQEEWRTTGRQLVMATEPLDLEALVEEAPAASAGGSSGSASEGVPAGTVMGHVHLRVGDLAEASRFYHAAVGFDKVVWSYPGALFLSAGGYHHHLGVNTWADSAPPAGSDDARLLRWTLILPDVEEIGRLAESVEAAGYPIGSRHLQKDAGNGGLRSRGLRLEDPWGTEMTVIPSKRWPV